MSDSFSSTHSEINDSENDGSETNDAQRLQLQVIELCNAIPAGKVISYGALGQRCDPPISGYICGRVMGNIHQQAPWWRVVGKNGQLPISKRSPMHSVEQRNLLEREGVEFTDDNTVDARFFVDKAENQQLDLGL